LVGAYSDSGLLLHALSAIANVGRVDRMSRASAPSYSIGISTQSDDAKIAAMASYE
jgi:hypothetical protein